MPSGLYNEHNCFNDTDLVETHLNNQHNRKQSNTTKKGVLNCNIHKLTYSAVIYRIMCVTVIATYHTNLNMSTISNIRLKVLLWGDNNTYIFYIRYSFISCS